MKIIAVFLLAGQLLAIYDIPNMLNPTAASAYSRINGGIGAQNYWSGFPGRTAATTDPTMAGYKAMYNVNSLAPFNGDRYTGYDAMSQRWAPPGTASSVYYPTATGLSENPSVDQNLMDFNSPAYRNFYDRYYEFYHKNLDILRAKMNVRKNPHEFDKVDDDSHFNSHHFDALSNYFSGTSREKAAYGPNLPDMVIRRSYVPSTDSSVTTPAERRMELINNGARVRRETAKELRSLRGKIQDIKKALTFIEKEGKRQARQLKDSKVNRRFNV